MFLNKYGLFRNLVVLFGLNIFLILTVSTKYSPNYVFAGCGDTPPTNDCNQDSDCSNYCCGWNDGVVCGGIIHMTNGRCTPNNAGCKVCGHADCNSTNTSDYYCSTGTQCPGSPSDTPAPPTNTPHPTRTPTPLASRTPTPSPTVTSTPGPTATITPLPSPTLPADACQCDTMTYDLFTPGADAAFTATAKVDKALFPDVKVSSIVFHVDKYTGVDLVNPTPMATQSVIPMGPVFRIDGTIGYDVYTATWTYPVPASNQTGNEIRYKVWIDITCEYISGPLIGQGCNYLQFRLISSGNQHNIAGISTLKTQSSGFLQSLKNFMVSLWTVTKNSSPLAFLPKKQNPNVLSAEVRSRVAGAPSPTSGFSLKLKTMDVAILTDQGCDYLVFEVID